MPKVQVYKLKNDGTQEIIAECRLDNEIVICEGDASLINLLTDKGITNHNDPNGSKLFPKDGLIFLQQLSLNFRSGYLNASDIQE